MVKFHLIYRVKYLQVYTHGNYNAIFFRGDFRTPYIITVVGAHLLGIISL